MPNLIELRLNSEEYLSISDGFHEKICKSKKTCKLKNECLEVNDIILSFPPSKKFPYVPENIVHKAWKTAQAEFEPHVLLFPEPAI